jgi:hypothetical protein
VLGLQKAVELLVGDLHAEVPEQAADETGVLDLLDRARHPEHRLVVLAEVRGGPFDLGQVVPPERLEPRAVPRFDQRGVVRELHQRVAPVEENAPQHGR